MSLVANIKAQIKARLDELKIAGTLAEVQEDDLQNSVLIDRDFAAFPSAILTGPAIEGDYFTNSQNMRTHTFEIVVVNKVENITGVAQIDDLVEAILDKFDQDFNLQGTADGGVKPATSAPVPVQSRSGVNYILFTVVIQAKAIKTVM